ncbi:DUF3467 domain-containing protein [Moheibacter sediminis]|uniref:DUF3467 domain-containing protein n=1 Tax=Moheibacter sediminis TaxID=1434700 RepID=A0A1W1ZVW5_9FLAO|nr:DUF3467 domain-containing protein [Moheibacter sediminis]SMC52547.1 Protein of unknown function [Moheibacter sediminis]
MSEEKKQNIDIEINDQVSDGIYSNLAVINHSPTEFVVDFIQMMPGVPKARVKSRIILTPQHAKRLVNALAENVRRYEAQFGEVKEQQSTAMPFNFGPPGEA